MPDGKVSILLTPKLIKFLDRVLRTAIEEQDSSYGSNEENKYKDLLQEVRSAIKDTQGCQALDDDGNRCPEPIAGSTDYHMDEQLRHYVVLTGSGGKYPEWVMVDLCEEHLKEVKVK